MKIRGSSNEDSDAAMRQDVRGSSQLGWTAGWRDPMLGRRWGGRPGPAV